MKPLLPNPNKKYHTVKVGESFTFAEDVTYVDNTSNKKGDVIVANADNLSFISVMYTVKYLHRQSVSKTYDMECESMRKEHIFSDSYNNECFYSEFLTDLIVNKIPFTVTITTKEETVERTLV